MFYIHKLFDWHHSISVALRCQGRAVKHSQGSCVFVAHVKQEGGGMWLIPSIIPLRNRDDKRLKTLILLL